MYVYLLILSLPVKLILNSVVPDQLFILDGLVFDMYAIFISVEIFQFLYSFSNLLMLPFSGL